MSWATPGRSGDGLDDPSHLPAGWTPVRVCRTERGGLRHMGKKGDMVEPYDSRADTLAHIERVQHYLGYFIGELAFRGSIHDQSRLEHPEKSAFDIATPRLRDLEYGSDAYKAALADLQPALDHHYA